MPEDNLVSLYKGNEKAHRLRRDRAAARPVSTTS